MPDTGSAAADPVRAALTGAAEEYRRHLESVRGLSAHTVSASYASTAAGLSLPPKPRRSGASTRYPAAARARIWWRQEKASSGKP